MKKQIVILTSAMLFLTINISAQTGKSIGSLTFNITGFADNSGQVLVQLFRNEDKVPTKPFKVVKSKISSKKAVVEIENLGYGEYAAIIIHDLNSNGHIDHRLGMPNEPLGFTNNWKLSLFSGMPTFDKLKFTFNESNNLFDIKMNR